MTLSPTVDTLRVSIQGYAGAFHEAAARRYFSGVKVETVAAHTFGEVVRQVESGESDAAVMAIENTLAGSLLTNYDLLQRSDLRITGEVYLRIRQNLMALPGVQLNELREVYSHPIALMQVRRFFKTYPRVKLIESADTALSARDVRDSGDRSRGAVAHSLAAELYGLDILAAGIETNPLNHTRFLVLRRGRDTAADEGDKVSVSFAVSHESGSLARVLSILNAYKINLTKIQSTPIIGRPWQYRFYVDFELHEGITLPEVLAGIGPITEELHVQGIYPAGEKP
jgi:prephenate dehydratase